MMKVQDILNIIRSKIKNCYDFCWKNKIVEINGDFWHCNPKIYDKNYYNKMINMTAEDKW